MIVYSRYVHRVGHIALLIGTFAFLASTLFLFRWLLINETFLVSGAFYIFGKLYPLFLVSSSGWSETSSSPRVRAKRPVRADRAGGLILGGIAGSSLAALAADAVGSENLLLAAAVIVSACAILVLALRSDMQDREGRRSTGRLVGKLSGDAVKLLFESPHLRWIAAILFLTILVSTLVDWQLNRAVELFVPGEDAKTEFFGKFFLTPERGPRSRSRCS